MKVKDFIDVIRPLTACDPDCDFSITVSTYESGTDFAFICHKGNFQCEVVAHKVPYNEPTQF